MSSTRILHVLPHRGGGAETYIDGLERLPGFVHERFPLSTGRRPRDAFSSLPKRWPQLVGRAQAADLLHVHGDAAAILAVPLLAVRPAVVTTHGLHLVRRADGPARQALAVGLHAVSAVTGAIICTSMGELAELEPLVGRRGRRKLTVIHSGIDLPTPPAPGTREAVRAELGIASDVVLGLFAGQLEPRKAPLLAARAARALRAQGVPFTLAVAGKGPLAPALDGFAGEAVRPLGFRTDLPRLYVAADVFVQPSEREGISLALLEAMGHGLAIVAADGPGNPEALGDSGLVFPSGNESELVAALSRLCADRAFRDRLGARARYRARTVFGAAQFMSGTRAVYDGVL